MAERDPWADKPDRFDRADRQWRERWAPPSDDADEAAPPGPGYTPTRATPGTVHDAYGDGMRGAGPYLGLGAQIGGSMALFVGLGIVVDRWLGTSPWGVVVGAALGMAGVMVLVMRIANGPGQPPRE